MRKYTILGLQKFPQPTSGNCEGNHKWYNCSRDYFGLSYKVVKCGYKSESRRNSLFPLFFSVSFFIFFFIFPFFQLDWEVTVGVNWPSHSSCPDLSHNGTMGVCLAKAGGICGNLFHSNIVVDLERW